MLSKFQKLSCLHVICWLLKLVMLFLYFATLYYNLQQRLPLWNYTLPVLYAMCMFCIFIFVAFLLLFLFRSNFYTAPSTLALLEFFECVNLIENVFLVFHLQSSNAYMMIYLRYSMSYVLFAFVHEGIERELWAAYSVCIIQFHLCKRTQYRF